MTEESDTNPLTTYAEANLGAENSVLPLNNDDFTVTVLRQATVYGLSPRMRFDLAVNGMTLGLWQNNEIPVLRDGTQWRPMVYVADTARAFIEVMESEPGLVAGEIFNVGSDEQNYQILPLAKLGVPFQHTWYGDPDHRSYQASFAKIADRLGFKPGVSAEQAAREIAEALESGAVAPDPKTRTVDWYRSLIESGESLDDLTVDHD
jgi:nucleoside-diphosphate-sugar epimerase